MENSNLTRGERVFRVWMYISAWMYAVSGLCFLFGGGLIVKSINAFSARFLPSLPPYPLPVGSPEGGFWLVLSLSMMAMITYICRAAYLDPRRNGRLVPILLLSKFCSSAFYLAFFIANRQLAHLVGFFTDGPLFIVTLLIWLPASAGNKYIDGAEEDILVAIGDALFPRGGAFEAGYMDFRDENVADARVMFSKQYPVTLAGTRFLMRLIDLSPVYVALRPVTLRRLPLERRQDILRKVESHWFSLVRMMFFGVKLFATVPFFNREETLRAVGYLPKEGAE